MQQLLHYGAGIKASVPWAENQFLSLIHTLQFCGADFSRKDVHCIQENTVHYEASFVYLSVRFQNQSVA